MTDMDFDFDDSDVVKQSFSIDEIIRRQLGFGEQMTDEKLTPSVGPKHRMYKICQLMEALDQNVFTGSDGVSANVPGWTLRSKLPELFLMLDLEFTAKDKIKYNCVSDESKNYDADKTIISFLPNDDGVQCIIDIINDIYDPLGLDDIYQIDAAGLPLPKFDNILYCMDQHHDGKIKATDYIELVTKGANTYSEEEKEQHNFYNIQETTAKSNLTIIDIDENGYMKYVDIIRTFVGVPVKFESKLSLVFVDKNGNKKYAHDIKVHVDSKDMDMIEDTNESNLNRVFMENGFTKQVDHVKITFDVGDMDAVEETIKSNLSLVPVDENGVMKYTDFMNKFTGMNVVKAEEIDAVKE